MRRICPANFRSSPSSAAGREERRARCSKRWTPEAYYPIDVSGHALDRCRKELDGLSRIETIEGSYIDGLDRIQRNGEPILLLFLGSTIGNFDSRCRADFLRQVRSRMRAGDAMLIGCDLIKPVETMLDAYDDPSGVTASFNLNLLGRIDRELGGDFNLRAFAHEARWNPEERRIEMHLRSRVDQTVTIREGSVHAQFEAGETIWTESSHKFRAARYPEIASRATRVSASRKRSGSTRSGHSRKIFGARFETIRG